MISPEESVVVQEMVDNMGDLALSQLSEILEHQARRQEFEIVPKIDKDSHDFRKAVSYISQQVVSEIAGHRIEGTMFGGFSYELDKEQISQIVTTKLEQMIEEAEAEYR